MNGSNPIGLDRGLYTAMNRKGLYEKREFENAKTIPVTPRPSLRSSIGQRARLLGVAAALGGALTHPRFPEADGMRGSEKYVEDSSGPSFKQRMTSPDDIGERTRALERRGYQLESLYKNEMGHVLPESDEKLSEEFSEHIAARMSREVPLLFARTDILTRDMYGQAFQAVEVAVDTCINRVLRASLQDMEREEQKTGNLLQADLFAVRAFADGVLTFIENHPERGPAAEPIIEALIHHAEDQYLFARQNTPEASPAYQDSRASLDLFVRDLRGTQFRVIQYTDERIEHIGDATDIYGERVLAALHAALPWFITNRADIAADPAARIRTIGALRGLLILPSHSHARHHAMRLLLRYLERN